MKGVRQMNAVLVSEDQGLAKSCREVLSELLDSNWVLSVEDGRGPIPPHDLCIWDFTREAAEALALVDRPKLQRWYFLANKAQLPHLQELAGTAQLHILLKPVSAATLRAQLAEPCRTWREQNDNPVARMGTLRAERDYMLQSLLQANLRLQEYDQERTNFLARSTHDFRAPLTAVAGYCSLLLEGQLGSITAEQREILERMQRSARRLSRMANGMFQLSIAGRGVGQTLNLQDGDIRDCIEQALHETSPFVEGKRIIVNTDIAPSVVSLVFDKSQMEQMLINLLDNACKFTPRGGLIDIHAYPFFWERRNGRVGEFDFSTDRRLASMNTPNSFRIDIRDSGPEIPAAHLTKIFEEYTSYAGGQDRSGGGLGLAICKMIARQHQGKIWAENTPEGPVFSFVLSLQPAQHCLSAGDGMELLSYVV
jgi:signal transduction histidine kinase